MDGWILWARGLRVTNTILPNSAYRQKQGDPTQVPALKRAIGMTREAFTIAFL